MTLDRCFVLGDDVLEDDDLYDNRQDFHFLASNADEIGFDYFYLIANRTACLSPLIILALVVWLEYHVMFCRLSRGESHLH